MSYLVSRKALILLLAAFICVGCSNTAQGVQEDTKNNVEKATENSKDAMNKMKAKTSEAVAAAEVTPAVKSAIVADPKLKEDGNLIDVDTTKTTVTLNGHVNSLDEKALAESVAKTAMDKLSAKQTLVNKLEVKKP